jgi:ABC-type dipeptide/oligopeptide/nickel transport system permease component
MDGLAAYILRRLLFLPITLLIVSFATFYITRWGPGDPVSIYSGQFRDEEAFDRVRAQYGLDKPIYQQYGIWLEDLVLHGDFGPSFRYRDRDIPDVIAPKMWVSFRLGLYAFVLSFLIGIPVGVLAAVKRGTWIDPAVVSFFLLFQSIPVLVSTPMLVLVLAAKLHWVPSGGFDGLFSTSMIIPTIALTLPGVAGVARLSRASMLQTLDEDYLRTARAKGLSERVVIWTHAARSALVPVMTTVIGLSVVGLLEGAFFTETLLGIPGIGRFIFESVNGRDYNVILAVVLIISTLFVLMNLVVDIALVIIDPRIRAGRSAST